MAETQAVREKREAREREKRADPVLRHLDLRLPEARRIERWRKDLIESLGGKLSPGQKAMIEQAALLQYWLWNVNATTTKKTHAGQPIGACLRDHARLTKELNETIKALGADKGELSLEMIRRELSAREDKR